MYVKVDISEEKTSSGLLLPVSAQKKPTQGEIVGAGTAKAVKVSNSSAFGVSIVTPEYDLPYDQLCAEW